jgi:hypothetical protein
MDRRDHRSAKQKWGMGEIIEAVSSPRRGGRGKIRIEPQSHKDHEAVHRRIAPVGRRGIFIYINE